MADTYSDYLEALRVGLKSGCGGAKTEQILAEAKAHLEEGIEELIERGLTRQAAEQTVMARFGDANAVCRWYAEQHRRPSVWRASRLPLLAIGVSVLFWNFQNEILPFHFLAHFGSLICLNSLLAITIVLCFRSKRFTSGVICLAAAGFFAVLIACFSLLSVPLIGEHGTGVIARSSVESTVERAKKELARNEENLATFTDGKRAFTSSTEPAGGVGRFHDSRGYLSPIYFQSLDPRFHAYLGEDETNGIFHTYREARNFWISQPSRMSIATGKREIYYIADAADGVAQCRKTIQTLPTAFSLPLRDKMPAFVENAKFQAIFLLGFGLIADLSGGMLRMLAEFIQKRRRSRGPLTS